MYTIENHTKPVKVVTCDRCGRHMSEDEPATGYNNRTQIRFRAGYASLFGDGNKVEGDLCDACLYELLGRYLHIVESNAEEAQAFNADPASPLESFFDMEARRVYAPYQTPYQMVESTLLILRDWIDACFDVHLKRTPVVVKPDPAA